MKWCAQSECCRNKPSGGIHLTHVRLRAGLYCLEECIFPLCLFLSLSIPLLHIFSMNRWKMLFMDKMEHAS